MHLIWGYLWGAKNLSHHIFENLNQEFTITRWLMFLSLLVLRWPTLSGSKLAEVVRNKLIASYNSFLKRQINLSSAAMTPFSACQKNTAFPFEKPNQSKRICFRATSFVKDVLGSHSPGSPAAEPQWFPETGFQLKIRDVGCSGLQVKNLGCKSILLLNAS